MASPHKALPRRLFEVLEEQQEPFILLIDRAFSERIVQSRPTFLCWRPRRKRGGFWGCLPTKLRCWGGGIKRALNWHSRAPHHGRWSVSTSRRVEGGFQRLSCSGASTEAELDGDVGWKEYELSPVSVLDVVHSDEDSSVHNHSLEGDNSAMEVGTVGFAPLPLFQEAKREVALQEEINCVWESQWGDLARITNLISLDLKNWGHFQDQKREIGIEIEGFIMEELREECVLDMML